MTNPAETLKQILRGAKEEIEKWPEWMKDQEPVLRRQSSPTGLPALEPHVFVYGDKHRYEGKFPCFCTQLVRVGELGPRFCGRHRADPIHEEETVMDSRFDRISREVGGSVTIKNPQEAAAEFLGDSVWRKPVPEKAAEFLGDSVWRKPVPEKATYDGCQGSHDLSGVEMHGVYTGDLHCLGLGLGHAQVAGLVKEDAEKAGGEAKSHLETNDRVSD